MLAAGASSTADAKAKGLLSLPVQPEVSSERPSAWEPPTQFEHFRLQRRLGQGSMGQVFVGHDGLLDRAVAIKFIAAVSPDEGARQRFMREARAIARLLHPNVVTVHSVGQVDGHPYLVTELVRGRSLAQLDRPQSGERVLSIAIDLCRGLAAAHRRGVLHRDLKPANAIDSDEGTVKLLDFGLAKLVSRQRSHGSQPEITDPIDAADAAAFPPTLVAASVTQRGMLIGTPLYIAPEIWLGQPASVQTDLYSLGAVLYELSTGIPPVHAGSLAELRRKVLAGGIPACSSLAATIDARLAQAIDRCLARDPVVRPRSAEDLLQDLLRIQPQHTRRPPDGNPFRGLHVFHAEHRAVFFGRETDLTEAIERLRTQSLLVLLGDSGVGKSSLAYAAILPDVESGALGDGRTFKTISLAPGTDPQMALATALSRTMAWPVATLYQQIGEEPAALARAIQERLANDAGLLIFLDQMEELVTTAQPDAAQRTAEFLAQLALGWPGLRVLASLRADFLTRIGALPALGRMLATSVQMILPLDRSALRLVMTEPLRQKGYAFESEAMIDEILDAVPGDGGLPLLQFSLSVLWDLRDSGRRRLPASALAQIGGPTGALAHHADLLLASLLPEQRAAARRVLCKLVSAEDTRRPRPESQLLSGDASEKAALSALVQGRLVIAREASDGDSCYELTHEALIRDWPTLRDWLTNEGERRAVRQRLEEAAAHWEALARSSEALWGDAPLDDLTHTGVDPNLLGEREQVFLTRSIQARRRRRRLRRTAFVLAPLLVVVLTAAALVSVQSRRNAERTEAFRQKEADLNTAMLARTPGNERQLLRQALESVAPELGSGRPISQNALARLRSAVHVGRQSMPLVGHLQQVVWAAFSPDSQRVVTLDLQEQALAWDVSSGRQLFALRHDEALSYRIFYSPDGRFIMAPLLNGKTRVWEGESGRWLVDLDASTKSASHVAFSPDGRFVAIASGMSARAVPVTVIWDLATFSPLRTLSGHTQEIEWVAYSPDGRYIASAANDSTVRMFHASTGKQQYIWKTSSPLPSRVLFSPDGQLVLGAYKDGAAYLWRSSDGREAGELKGHRGQVTDAVFSGTGTEILTAGQDGTVRIWNVATSQTKHVLVGHESKVNSVQYIHSADRIVSASDDGEIRIWHLHTGRLLSRLRGHSTPVAFAFPSPSERYLISGGGKDDPPRLWNAETFINTLPIGRVAEAIYHIPNSLILVESSESSSHSVWDARSGLPISQLQADSIGPSTIIGWSNNGEYLWTRGFRGSDRSVNRFHIRTGALKSVLRPNTVNHPHHVLAGLVNIFFDISPDHQARFSDASTNRPLMVLPLRPGSIGQISISANGDYGGITYNDGELFIVNHRARSIYSCGFQSNTRSRMLIFTPMAEYVIFLLLDGKYRILKTSDCNLEATGNINAESWDMAISPNGQNAVPTGLSNNLVIIDVPGGQINEVSRIHTSSIVNASFSSDGKRLISSSYDTTVRVFDVLSKKQISAFVEHGGYVNSAQFSPDNKRIASASADGTVRIWDPLTGQPVQPPEDGQLLRPVVSLSDNEWKYMRESPPKSPQEGTALIQMSCRLLRHQPEYPAVARLCANFLADR